MSDDLVIRNMTRAELDQLVGWAATEGWNPGLHDAALFWATDPDAFIAAELDGELIGGGAITSYGGEFGFMGFFIVRPAFRGRGLGNTLWHARRDRLIARLQPGATIGLDGVFAMQDYYARGGFVFSHRNLRFRAEVPDSQPRSPEPSRTDEAIVPLDEVPFDEVLAYDASDLDRDVVAPDQIRTVLATFRDKVFTEMFPGRTDLPKTLIFAKDDTHADDIVRICREVFGKGNDFCQKITYRTGFVRITRKVAEASRLYQSEQEQRRDGAAVSGSNNTCLQ